MGKGRRGAVSVGAAAACLVLLAATGCSQPPARSAGAGGDGEAPAAGAVTVFAAASLTEAFTAIAQVVEQDHAGLSVQLSFAGSQQLAAQIVDGASADVFAAADETQMDVVADAGRTTAPPEVFVANTLAIAVEPGNPEGIRALADLARPDLSVVLPAEEVPAGRYARTALRRAGVDVTPASLETDVRGVLGKVGLGEADAGIVYRSDIAAAQERVDAVEIPAADNVVATYRIAPLADAPNAAGAQAFIAAVRSPVGQDVLRDHGFSAP